MIQIQDGPLRVPLNRLWPWPQYTHSAAHLHEKGEGDYCCRKTWRNSETTFCGFGATALFVSEQGILINSRTWGLRELASFDA
jgi:hypothetical protein